jgi:hypothetical protein
LVGRTELIISASRAHLGPETTRREEGALQASFTFVEAEGREDIIGLQ